MEDFEGRKVVLKALVGSCNYNLNTATSDKDYKYFVAPTFDDLYSNKSFSDNYVSETVDYSCHDVRKIGEVLWKSNINFLEILFSKELIIKDDDLNELFELKNDIVTMNLPVLYEACVGMFYSRIKLLHKGTQSTQVLVDKFGYDTKQAMHSIRPLNFLENFVETKFTDFGGSIYYEDKNPTRVTLLSIKNGLYEKEEFLNLANSYSLDIQRNFKSLYKSQKPNIELRDHVNEIVKKVVKNNFEVL